MANKKQTDTHPEKTRDVSERFFHDIKIEFLVHELKTPMAIVETAIRSLLQAREIYGKLSPKQEKVLHRALRNSDKLRGMVHNLLEIGRSESGCFFCRRFHPVEVAESVLADTTEAIRWEEEKSEPSSPSSEIDWAQYHIRLEVAPAAVDLHLNQDEIKYRQIITNLVKNALDHRRQWMEMRLTVQDNRLCIEVKDDGPGIAAKHHQMIFQRYAQVGNSSDFTRRGHGLGLAGARILARCMGGDIRIESEENQGANFIVDLPLLFPGQDG
jgi:signal transduction histidine kinase